MAEVERRLDRIEELARRQSARLERRLDNFERRVLREDECVIS
jgi:hypothetical protein